MTRVGVYDEISPDPSGSGNISSFTIQLQYGVVQYGMVWFSTVCSGIVLYGMVFIVQFGVV